ncbi:flagellar protein FlgN [Paenalcaligenes niemegkensis]|uniref:flagella synthesis protein FlgN n=1 Tax=Paenalcaligenes niemegkensis TaxID=2895469 RepID=UPI001EE8D780|nr:flagellar protein FlgN [Paenalcaligenes niemegkensis]MCQ9615980.1 flagellar protein FlgN [Paenalcaligenes niemegkensis]
MALEATSSLQQALQAEIELLLVFNTALTQETELLLSNHDNDALNENAALKTQFSEALAAANQRRVLALNELNLPDSKQGLEEAVNLDSQLGPLVEELFRLAQQAKVQNENNGTLIHTFLQHNEQALEALGQLTQPVEKVYDASGKTSVHRAGSRASIKA